MAIVTATNSTLPNTIKWPTTDADIYDRATQLAGVTENFENHDHDTGKNLGVKRVQWTTSPTAVGHVMVNANTWQWWASGAAAVRTACDLESAQTITGLKQFPSLVAAGIVYIGDNANAFQTVGLTINQGGNDNEIVALKSSDIAHGITSLTETDTYGLAKKFHATNGGLDVWGASAASTGARLLGLVGTGDTTKSTAAVGAIALQGSKKTGTSATVMGANENIVVVTTNGQTTHILDSDGDSHQDVGTAWTNFDEYDDAALLTALAVGVSREGDPIKERFGAFLDEQRDALARARLVTFNDDGHHFVNFSRLTMALVGAVRQVADRIDALETRLALQEG